jgi:hypothetical protein
MGNRAIDARRGKPCGDEVSVRSFDDISHEYGFVIVIYENLASLNGRARDKKRDIKCRELS